MDSFLTKTRTTLISKFRYITKTLTTTIITIQLTNTPWTRLAPRQSIGDIERDVEDRYVPPTVLNTPSTRSLTETDTESTLSISDSSPPSPHFTLTTPATWPTTPINETPPETPASILPITPIDDDFDMTDLNSITFTGKPEDGDPQDFMNRLERLIIMKTGLTVQEKVKLLELSLKAKSPAAAWWATLTSADKATFADAKTAFEIRWPVKPITEKTTAEKQALLDATILKPSDLGKRIAASIGAEEELTHVVWADKVERLAGDIPDTNNLLVSAARKNLPKAISRIVGWKATTWKELCDAVRAISLEELLEKIEDERDLARHTIRPTVPNTPSKALSTAFQNINLTPQTRGATTATTYHMPQPQIAPRSSTGNFIERPLHERLGDVLNKALPLQPNNTEGVEQYKQQIAAWQQAYGQNGKGPSETRPYPLTPGTFPVASNECWKCGHRAHYPTPCSAPLVPPFEQKWRSIAGTIRKKAEAAGAPSINVHAVGIESDEVQTYDANELAHLQLLANQGKGGGPSL